MLVNYFIKMYDRLDNFFLLSIYDTFEGRVLTMIKISFTDEDIKELHHERFYNLHPRVQMKMEALYLKAMGHKHKDIAKSLCLSETTVRSYIVDYAKGGIEALNLFSPHEPKSELRHHTTTLKAEFEKNPPSTSKEAVQRIYELTGIKRSPTQVREFLKKTGLSILKRGKPQQKRTPPSKKSFLKRS